MSNTDAVARVIAFFEHIAPPDVAHIGEADVQKRWISLEEPDDRAGRRC